MDKYSFEVFCKVVAEGLVFFLPKQYKNMRTELSDVPDNNGTVYRGLSVITPGCAILPVLNMNILYEAYLNGTSICDILSVAAKRYVKEYVDGHHMLVRSHETFELCFSFEKAKDFIIFSLVNAEKNAELLKNCPHRMVADLAVVYSLFISDDEGSAGTFIIKNIHKEIFNVDEETLWKCAQANTPRLLPFNLCPLDVFALNMAVAVYGRDSEEVQHLMQESFADLFHLSNSLNMNGASVLLYPGLLKSLEDMIGKFYIIPSSTEEVLLLPACADKDELERFPDFILKKNNAEVPLEKVLSDHLYKPSEDGLFEIAR